MHYKRRQTKGRRACGICQPHKKPGRIVHKKPNHREPTKNELMGEAQQARRDAQYDEAIAAEDAWRDGLCGSEQDDEYHYFYG